MTPRLTRIDVLRIASLARLELTDQEVDLFTGQLAHILDYAQDVQGVDTEGIEPTSHPFDAGPRWREDIPLASLERADALANAPAADRSAGLFKVPRVL